MRQLTKQEKEINTKQSKRLQKELDLEVRNLEYNKDLLKKNLYLREFDDKWRKFLRERKDIEDEQILNRAKMDIKDKRKTVELLESQLTKGVEKKIPLGIN